MSSLAFLVTELQSLASETRRKHPDIREAAEKSLAILRASPEQATAHLASDGPQSDDLLRPVFMGCATKNAKVVAISLGSLQRLIALKAVPQSAVELIINTMSDAMSQGVDIQLRILQTLLSLVTNFPAVHGSLLGEALLLCFKLQESKIAVVSSTAAATLRQLVMFVFDKMVDEDRRDDSDPAQWVEMKLPNGTTKSLGPSARDAFSVFEDLCLLANSEKPNFLRLEFLHKTFALELIESVLTNYHDLFRNHTELVLLLQLHLCPLLLKALSDRPLFPLTLRCTRVVFLLLKQFSLELETEAEIFLTLLIKIVGEDHSEQSEQGPRPQWMRVLAMEIMRGLCSDAQLMRNVWARYDARHTGSNVFTALITALKRLVTEKPALLGVSAQIFGVGVLPDNATGASNSGYGLDVAGMAGMVATAASATVSGVVGMMGTSGGLSLQGSAMKLQCIDQLDKADAPPIPESYIYLLAVQCIVSLCEGFAAFTGPLYSTIVIQRPRAAGEAVIRAPPALDLASLPDQDPSTAQLRIVSQIIESGWPALLAALSFIIATNLSDDLFVEVLASYQAMTNVAGMLGLTTPRDAFFTSLSKFAVPTRVVSSLDHSFGSELQTPRSAASLSENLGFSTGPAQPPGLSDRNLACLKVLVASALFLAGSLGESWFGILEALQNADYVLTSKAGAAGTKRPAGSRTVSSSGATGSRHALLSDLEPEALQGAIQRLFDASKNLEDDAFRHFTNALCKLSAEMVGMQTEEGQVVEASERVSLDDPATLTPKIEAAHRRRVSGIHLPRTLRSGDFGINKLGGVALLNIHRLIYRSPDVAWDIITKHLLSIVGLPYAPQSIRIQAARVLDEILVIVPRNISTTGDLQAQVQKRVLDVLAQQIIPDASAGGASSSTSTSVELRRMGLETLHQILEASGHTLVVGWETIFEMLASVCKPLPPAPSTSLDSPSELASPASPSLRRPLPLGLGNPSEKSYSALVKIAFQSLTLVCNSVSSLSPAHLRLCISTLAQFGRQADTNIALTAAASLLWSVSDAIQSKRKNAEEEPEYNSLWMFLLLEVLGLGTDARPEVRDGAIQTLFRTMQLYGATLSLDTWDQCIWKVTFPLLDSLTTEIRRFPTSSPLPVSDASSMTTATIPPGQAWDDSKTLTLQSVGSIFHDFLSSKIIHLESFVDAWNIFVNHIQDTVLLDNRSISPPALRSLEKAIKASSAASADVKSKVAEIWQRVWTMADSVGEAIMRRGNAVSPHSDSPHKPFTQESLVAFMDVIRCTRSTSRSLDGEEWPLERLTRLMAILKGILTYPSSPDYRPDIDQLPPVQSIVLDTIVGIDLTAPGCPSLIMSDLSEFATLPFLAAFDVPANPKTQTPQKRVTYIALAKKVMPMLVDLFLRFKEREEIFVDGTIEAVLSAYSIPVKLKYECPPASKFGHDLPLWKTATSNFLKIVKECVTPMQTLASVIPDEHIEGIWRQVLDVFRGGILADCSATETFPLEKQEEEENFDLALIGALEIDVVPHLGDMRVPDALVGQLARVLQQGSRLYESEVGSNPHSPVSSSGSREFVKIEMDGQYENGTTQNGTLVPRERFSYWCFDLLFLICSNTTRDQEPSRRRLAALSLPSLLARCRSVLVGYVADEALRGNLPFPRAREDELLYVLRKLRELRLWSGSLWAAVSEEPSTFAVEQPAVDTSLSPSLLIADAVKRSSIAHLFHFYPVLCEIASIPRKAPSTWVLQGVVDKVSPSQADNTIELDARVLARDCLKEVGKEMGVLQ
ncbi:protein MON2 [Favolaschia claudopus]|uniref:Protein MON2 n=1 Tax=Favolaschia claudopus TaxID=2862362 RepID=A0AAW0CMQ9_9AGAR